MKKDHSWITRCFGRRLVCCALALCMHFFHTPVHAYGAIFRDAAADKEHVALALRELTEFYKSTPGFVAVTVVKVDTLALARGESGVSLSGKDGGRLGVSKRPWKVLGEETPEWKGASESEGGGFQLKKIRGEFYGSYHEAGRNYFITPYRAGDMWITVRFAFEEGARQCGMGMDARDTMGGE